MTKKILFVDDDAHILAAYERQLRDQFSVETALNGELGLAAVTSHGPFAVIIADMRMPGMDGIHFLAQVNEIARDSVRMMLTGNSDEQTAIDAVNEGYIFRFLTKPCPPETLTKSLLAGIEQYRLITAEKELLEQTFIGSVQMLNEILSLANPIAFGRTARIRRIARHVINNLNLVDAWQYELAAMLSQIGCVTLPHGLIDKAFVGAPLTDAEKKMFAAHPSVGRTLLERIPRLAIVALMVEGQQRPFSSYETAIDSHPEKTIAFGAQIIRAALDYDQLVSADHSLKYTLKRLSERIGEYNPQVLATLEDYRPNRTKLRVVQAGIADLRIGMIVDEDIETMRGSLLLKKGQEVTLVVLEHLQNFNRRSLGVAEPFRVLVPRL